MQILDLYQGFRLPNVNNVQNVRNVYNTLNAKMSDKSNIIRRKFRFLIVRVKVKLKIQVKVKTLKLFGDGGLKKIKETFVKKIIITI